jgi:8-oxo-dGTP pyrophosphatase MutT (NUDIX family)
MEKVVTTLCFIIDSSRILLAMKKRGFGEGWWNGYGGKVGAGESIEAAAKRETQEEIGVAVEKLEPIGQIDFRIIDENKHIECHIFLIREYSGEPAETEEMRPQWFYFNEIPFDRMWSDDRYWFPYLLESRKFKAWFTFQDKKRLLDHKIEEMTDENRI